MFQDISFEQTIVKTASVLTTFGDSWNNTLIIYQTLTFDQILPSIPEGTCTLDLFSI